ncbi:Polyphenol oxidase, central domain-containing protein [Artemisia annua]|uniref:Polyphenol oxidase, central domain-containing protein n=1 Tax=Artemisia annua TaxID=35608 RepID=A0A2U1L3G7_ARTAN|nr:Polyphenol oxidase, central domain-containing protein [Artemisia annua]
MGGSKTTDWISAPALEKESGDGGVKDDDEETAPDQTEFAGSFAQLPHKHKGKSSSKTNFRAGLTELLEELEADDDDNVLVTIVPRSGSEDITIDAIKIIYA